MMQTHLSIMYSFSGFYCLRVYTLQPIMQTLCKQVFFLQETQGFSRNIAVGVNPLDATQSESSTGKGTQYTDKSKYRFLNSFNMFKGLKMSYSYDDSNGNHIEKSVFVGTKFDSVQTKSNMDLLVIFLFENINLNSP